MQSCKWTPGCKESVRPPPVTTRRRSSVAIGVTFYYWSICRISSSDRRLLLQQQGLCTLTSKGTDYGGGTIFSSVNIHGKVSHAYVEQEALSSSSPSNIDSDLHHVLSSRPSIATLASILRHCGTYKMLGDGKLVHQHINRRGFHQNIFINNCLVLMYADCESMEEAQEAFDRIPRPNSYSWSILIKGYAQNNKLDEASHVFAKIPNPDVVAWNTMIAAYAQKQQAKEALDLFWKMQQEGIEPNAVTFVCTLEACSSLSALEEAQEFLMLISGGNFAEDKLVKTALMTLLGKFGRLDEAWSIFDKLPDRDVVSWN
eukprot:c10875_g2_i1 orf=65-1009(+)